MNITFTCPLCSQDVRRDVAGPRPRHRVPGLPSGDPAPPGAIDHGRLTRCLVCPSTDLFVRKDFSAAAGGRPGGAGGWWGSSVAWGFGRPIATFAILFATALVDVVLYLIVPNALMCYRCGAQYRQVVGLTIMGLSIWKSTNGNRQAKHRGRPPARSGRPQLTGRSGTAPPPAAGRLGRLGLGPANTKVAPTPVANCMDQERERIKDDLRGLVKGDVRCDDVFVQLYASDASIFEIRPLAVVRPRVLADVVAVVRYAAENQLPIHPRGAGTGLAGESLGRGIVVDFSRYMRRILDSDADSVRVQPGVVHARLNEHLRERGRQFGPDPAMSIVTTMGSVVAIDAGGSHWLKYGSARQHVRSLQIVLADGEVMTVGREAVAGPQFDSTTPRGRLVSELADVILRNRQTIETHQPQSLVNRFGYQLRGVLGEQELDLPKLLSGSEGTLALITEIVGGHAALGPAAGRRAAAVRSTGKCRPGGRRNDPAGAERLRPDGSPASQPGPRKRPPSTTS